MGDTTVSGHLRPVDTPDLSEVVARFQVARKHHRAQARRAWIGTLVVDFTNEELRLLADQYFTVADTVALRRLGLLGPNEGFDGTQPHCDSCAAGGPCLEPF